MKNESCREEGEKLNWGSAGTLVGLKKRNIYLKSLAKGLEYCFYCLFAKFCQVFCNPVDCSQSGSSVHGISQARILEQVAIPFSRGSSLPTDWTQVSCIAGRFFTFWVTREAYTKLFLFPNCFINFQVIKLSSSLCFFFFSFPCLWCGLLVAVPVATLSMKVEQESWKNLVSEKPYQPQTTLSASRLQVWRRGRGVCVCVCVCVCVWVCVC